MASTMQHLCNVDDREDNPVYALLAAGTLYEETVDVKTNFPSSCGIIFTHAAARPASQNSFTQYIETKLLDGPQTVVFQRKPSTAFLSNESVLSQLKKIEPLAALRRKINHYLQLKNNWDGEGAQVVSQPTINTALQVIEHIAIVLERKRTSVLPKVRASADGSIVFKWIFGNKELVITVIGTNLEVQRWEPLDAFQSQGLWEHPIDAAAEHVEWVLT
jgi:hypothetical protein